LRRLYLAAIAVLVSLGAVPPASAAPPAYSGTYVIINPYYFVDETQSISSEPLTQNKREDYDLHFPAMRDRAHAGHDVLRPVVIEL
jgi:hypothetical protein